MTPKTPAAATLMMIAAATFASAQPDRVARADNPVPGQYIVVVDEDAMLPAFPALAKGDAMLAAAAEVAREHRIDVRTTFENALRGFVARMSEADAEALAAEPWVTLVEEDAYLAPAGTQDAPPSWGLDRIDQRPALLDGIYAYQNDGAGVDVFVIDSGIRSTHVELAGRVDTTWAYSSVADGYLTEDRFGHGTMVAGIIGSLTYGAAKGVTLHPVRILDASGMGTISGMVAAVDWVTQSYLASGTTTTTTKVVRKKSVTTTTTVRRPAVVNISISSGSSMALDAAVESSIAAGITYVAAAGNLAYDACYYSPARVPGVITVGASTDADTVWSASNGGTCVDLFAPGVLVPTTLSRTDTDVAATTGTSASAPLVTGAAALYLAANPTATPAQVAQAIVSQATPDALAAMPAGSPNRMLYSASLGADMPPAAAFSVSCSRRSCSFNASASSDDRGIASYSWSFGDGATAAGVTASHRYPSSPRQFTATLTVTDSQGQSSSLSRSISF